MAKKIRLCVLCARRMEVQKVKTSGLTVTESEYGKCSACSRKTVVDLYEYKTKVKEGC